MKAKDHARRAREAFRAYTAYDFEKANAAKYEENLREEYALAAMVANNEGSQSSNSGSRLGENVYDASVASERNTARPFNP